MRTLDAPTVLNFSTFSDENKNIHSSVKLILFEEIHSGTLALFQSQVAHLNDNGVTVLDKPPLKPEC